MKRDKAVRIEPTVDAHNECLSLISNATVGSLILFLGHGQSDKLFGASSDGATSNYKAFREKGFINKDNASIFANKRVISVSCNSNEKLGKYAEAGKCQCFVGFGYIPTDWVVERERYTIKLEDVQYFNEILCCIVASSIIYSIHHKFTFDQFERFFKILANKKIIEKFHHEYSENAWWIDESLYNLKDEIKVFGEPSLKLINI